MNVPVAVFCLADDDKYGEMAEPGVEMARDEAVEPDKPLCADVVLDAVVVVGFFFFLGLSTSNLVVNLSISFSMPLEMFS